MNKFKIGDGVTVITGPFKGIYGVIVFYDKNKKKYLVRFTGNQQFYYLEDEIKMWER
ncbi:hypothetical protein B835_2009 [Enterococcus mundtii 3F]|uniref:hypothetical protein n=1 Tax=Enterococcus mundtii TaxID=53346 RepID=UPI002303357C|nr:hypothetical protein [Enterococcus mundtii]MDA9462081.1 hypothetical protein [Enterococcus mundtii 3F]